jgi:hypothetical protein
MPPRPQQITRSTAVADQKPKPRSLSQFFWSACLKSANDTELAVSVGNVLHHDTPVHATIGPEDFDPEDNTTAIIIPRDGIYAISYCVRFYVQPVDVRATGTVQIEVNSGWTELSNLVNFDGSESTRDWEFTRVGIPLHYGDRMTLWAYNDTDVIIQIAVFHLEATYLGPIGHEYDSKYGGPT